MNVVWWQSDIPCSSRCHHSTQLWWHQAAFRRRSRPRSDHLARHVLHGDHQPVYTDCQCQTPASDFTQYFTTKINGILSSELPPTACSSPLRRSWSAVASTSVRHHPTCHSRPLPNYTEATDDSAHQVLSHGRATDNSTALLHGRPRFSDRTHGQLVVCGALVSNTHQDCYIGTSSIEEAQSRQSRCPTTGRHRRFQGDRAANVGQAPLWSHLLQSPSFVRLQSAYRCGHSTKTALLHVTNTAYVTADNNKFNVLPC